MASHGKRSAYVRGCRCSECRRANAEYQRDADARRLARLKDDGSEVVAHGLCSTYNNWGCRCEPCREAKAGENARARSERLRRSAAGDESVPHGTVSGYNAWGCRCEPCLEIGRAHERNRRRAPVDA